MYFSVKHSKDAASPTMTAASVRVKKLCLRKFENWSIPPIIERLDKWSKSRGDPYVNSRDMPNVLSIALAAP